MEEIGPQNVVHVVTDNASNYDAAGVIIKARYPFVFKTSCAAHCIDLMLEDIDNLPTVKPTMSNARLIVNYIYRFKGMVALMRTFTNEIELKRPRATRFASHFICLESVLKQKEPLRFLVGSNGWQAHGKRPNDPEKDQVTEIIQSIDFWVTGKYVLDMVEPLVKVLRMVDSDQSTLAYIYEAIDRVKQAIKNMANDDLERYAPYCKIIDDRRARRLHNPIHAVAAYLNPKLYYEKWVKMDNDIRDGFAVVRQRLLTTQERKDLTEEITLYHSRHSKIFKSMSIDALNNTHPRLWWDIYGTQVPIMHRLAMRFLSQTCSSSACERNWSAFDAAQSKKRNRLEPTRLQDLVYVRMNLHMQKNSAAITQQNLMPIDLDNVIAFPTEGEEIQDGNEVSDSSDGEYVDVDDDESPNANIKKNEDDEDFDHMMRSCD